MKQLEIHTNQGNGKNKVGFKIQVIGEFTINNLRKLQETMVEALEGNKKITIETKNIEGFDFAACQLLISFHNTAMNKNIETIYRIQLQDEHIEFLNNTGLINHPVFTELTNN